MNIESPSQEVVVRMKRIKKVVRMIQFFVSASVIYMIVIVVVCLADMAGLHLSRSGVKINLSPLAEYTFPLKIPVDMIVLGLIRLALFFAIALNLFWWLEQVETGKFFAGEGIGNIKRIGWFILGDWLVTRLLDLLSRNGMIFDMEPVVISLMILLFAWVMDEGRKIREEQELTV